MGGLDAEALSNRRPGHGRDRSTGADLHDNAERLWRPEYLWPRRPSRHHDAQPIRRPERLWPQQPYRDAGTKCFGWAEPQHHATTDDAAPLWSIGLFLMRIWFYRALLAALWIGGMIFVVSALDAIADGLWNFVTNGMFLIGAMWTAMVTV